MPQTESARHIRGQGSTQAHISTMGTITLVS